MNASADGYDPEFFPAFWKAASEQSGYLELPKLALDTSIWETESEFLTSKINLLTATSLESALGMEVHGQAVWLEQKSEEG